MLHLAVIFRHNDWKVFSKNEIFNMSGLELCKYLQRLGKVMKMTSFRYKMNYLSKTMLRNTKILDE